MLHANKLSKRYGDIDALRDLTLDVNSGQVFCLLGANGAGKTTTINLFLGFLRPDGGTIRVDGIDVDEDPEAARARIAFVPEQVSLYPLLSGLENLEFFASLGRPDAPTRAQLLDFLRQSGLDPAVADWRVSRYSKGMRQKVGIAIALARGARALLLDEPMSGLDPKAANEFTQLIRNLSAAGAAVLMATHDIFRAKEAGTQVGIMKRGRLVERLDTAKASVSEIERIYLQHMRD